LSGVALVWKANTVQLVPAGVKVCAQYSWHSSSVFWGRIGAQPLALVLFLPEQSYVESNFAR
jgi:hypothetical protein